MKPGDFFLGVLDFLAVLLPGAIAVWLVTQYLDAGDLALLLTLGGRPLPESARWAAFLFGAYMLGHFVFMIGSYLDPMYDRWRKRTRPSDHDATFQVADKLRRELTKELSGGRLTTLKWSKSYVQIHSPGARVEIDRLEATSKFFRSLIVVSSALALHFLIHERRPGLAIACVVLVALSVDRFFDQRWKMTELSYSTAVIHARTKGAGTGGEQSDRAANEGN